MRTVLAHVENQVTMAYDGGSAAWVFDLDHWGTCGQGPDERGALADLSRALGGEVEIVVTERIFGDERSFVRDHLPCRDDERRLTMDILRATRQRTLRLVRSCTDAELDLDDPGRTLPAFATWRTLREMVWHIADTESRYYLPALGLPARSRRPDPLEELQQSAEHVQAQLRAVPADVVVESAGEVWTTVKLLRRLAWHERGELAVMSQMLGAARCRRHRM